MCVTSLTRLQPQSDTSAPSAFESLPTESLVVMFAIAMLKWVTLLEEMLLICFWLVCDIFFLGCQNLEA